MINALNVNIRAHIVPSTVLHICLISGVCFNETVIVVVTVLFYWINQNQY